MRLQVLLLLSVNAVLQMNLLAARLKVLNFLGGRLGNGFRQRVLPLDSALLALLRDGLVRRVELLGGSFLFLLAVEYTLYFRIQTVHLVDVVQLVLLVQLPVVVLDRCTVEGHEFEDRLCVDLVCLGSTLNLKLNFHFDDTLEEIRGQVAWIVIKVLSWLLLDT